MKNKKDAHNESADKNVKAEKKITKKEYKKPQLVEHGSVLELTQTGGSRTADFFGGLQP